MIPILKSHLSVVQGATQDEESAGLENYRYKHLTHIAPESRLLAKQGLKLKVNKLHMLLDKQQANQVVVKLHLTPKNVLCVINSMYVI